MSEQVGSTPIGTNRRAAFWGFCVRACRRIRQLKDELQGGLTPYDIDELLVDQDWRCAVSGIRLEPPKGPRQPFGPSLDRIVARGRYERGNVRVVCNIVNFAMNEWGEGAFRELIVRMRQQADRATTNGRELCPQHEGSSRG